MLNATLEQIQELANPFNIGKVLSYSPAGGHANANYYVVTDKGEYVLKIQLEKPDKAEKEKEIAYLQRIAEHNIPVTEYIQLADGSHFFETPDKYIVQVMERYQGDEPQINTKTVEATAQLLAKLHKVPHDWLPQRSHWLTKERLGKQFKVLTKEFGDQQEVQELLGVYQRVIESDKELADLPLAIVHGDLFPENILFHDGKVTAIIDWEEVGVGIALFDYLQSVIGFCFSGGRFHPDLYETFYNEYNIIRPFTRQEKAFFKKAMRFVGLNLAAWRYLKYNYYLPNKAMTNRYKAFWRLGLDDWDAPDPEDE